MNGARRPPPFQAPWWARGPHAQTLLARTLRPGEVPPLERERIETVDGDFLDLDWTPETDPAAPVVLVLHGLEGNSRRRYVLNACRELNARGLRTVSMNFRGCSGEPNRALTFYHSGETRDPRAVVETIRTRWPDRPVGALGFSLGGNVLLKLLGDDPSGGRGLIDAAAAMSVPYDLAAGCGALEGGGMARVYTQYFLRSLKRKVDGKRSRLGGVVDLDRVARVRSIRAFDDAVTAPLNGFESAVDYYARCSSGRALAGIRVPTLLLHAVDDPFLPASAIPRAEAEQNPHLTLALEARGGHVGFVGGSPGSPRFWGEIAAADFLRDTLTSRG